MPSGLSRFSALKALSISLLLAKAPERENVGGQAVLEGVMMRGPRRWSVDVRLSTGEIVSRVEDHVSLTRRSKFWGLPFIRGVATLFESLIIGYRALDYSAAVLGNADGAAKEPKDPPKPSGNGAEIESGASPSGKATKKEDSLGGLSLFLTVSLSLILAALIFIALPHFLALAAGSFLGFDEANLAFHLLDGAVKFLFFLAYVWGIGKIPEIKRVYSYHGAEHRAIYAWEAGLPLEPVMARHFPLWHPRCGTAFIFLLLALSVIFFAAVFPLIPFPRGESFLFRTLPAALLKILLTFPLAGLSYEISRRAGKPKSSLIWRVMIFPGLLIQRLTTRETDDSQLEVALKALREALNLETATSADVSSADASFGERACSTTTYN
ncbi:MAG: DUF1385 domain-containing protein [Deltaproteobacteria bacterium]|jgi:uncharacterized protein YqhQ|nr:DUF1385 domain-containing protein [Deltaproteobacteria bacterium]